MTGTVTGISAKTRNNVVQEKKYSERLQETLRKYNNRGLETAQVIEELIAMAKQFQDEMARDEALGLNPDEVAFYDALANNESAVRKLRILVRRTLQRYKYPPDKALEAVELVLQQAEVLSKNWS